MRMSAGAGAIAAGRAVESAGSVAGATPAPALAGRLGGAPEAIARGSSAAAKPDDAGASGAGGLAGDGVPVVTSAGRVAEGAGA
jgi:hypothetical protein